MIETKPREIDAFQMWNDANPVAGYFDYNAANDQIRQQQQRNQPQPIYQPNPEPPANDYNRMNREIKEQYENPTVRPAAEVLDDIYKMPEPKYDQARQDRLKRLSKVNAMGQGLQALGDIFSLSQGAMVNRRQDTGENQRLYSMFQGYDDDYARRMDQHNRDQFNLRLQQIMQQKQDKWRAEDMDWRKAEAGRNQYNTERQFSAMELDREERRKDRDQSFALQKENMDRMADQFDKSHGLQLANLQMQMGKYSAKLREDMDKNSFQLYDDFGNLSARVDTKGGLDKLLAVILKDPMAFKEIDALKLVFGEGLSPEIKKYLVGKYWNNSPAAIKWIERYSNPVTEKEDKKEAEKETGGQTGNAWLDGLGVKTGTTPAPAPAPQQQIDPAAAPATTSPQTQEQQSTPTLPGMGNRTQSYSPNNAALPGLKIQSNAEIDASAITSKYPENIRDLLMSNIRHPYTIAEEMAKGQGFTSKYEFDNYVRMMAQQISQDREALKNITRNNK